MVKVIDKRPTRPDDSLRKILSSVKTPASVPHGVKVAQPWEYVTFYDAQGTGHRWDGDAIAAYDARIAEGQEQVAKVQESLEAAESGLASATERIAAAEAELTAEATGEKAATYINANGVLVGRDAIFAGTVDVKQLNVTGEMAAEIVKAMSLEAKKLVVTEEAILNRLTVIQDIVTPELVAERINVKNLGAALVTSGAIQTSDQANRGVKITDAGVQAWDTAGKQTIRLNGTNNLITGAFQTSDDAVGRIRLFNHQHPVTQMQSGYLTFHGAGGTQGNQGVIEYVGDQISLSVRAGSEGGHTAPFRTGLNITPEGAMLAGKLNMSGQFSKSSSGLTARTVQFGAIPAGQSKETTITFYKVNNQSPYHFVQLSSSNFARLSSVSWTSDTSIKIRVHNLGATQANDVWLDVLLVAAER